MHDGETCTDFQQRIQRDEARKREQLQQNAVSERIVQRISKPCPKCTSRLDKYAGCDHVTCKYIASEFHYVAASPAKPVKAVNANMSFAGCVPHPIVDLLAFSR